MPPNRKARKRSVRDERASTLSGSMLQAFPAEILLNVVKMLRPTTTPGDRCPRDVLSLARMSATCRTFNSVCERDEAWREPTLRRFPRLSSLLQHMPAPHPPFRTLYRQQLHADALPPPPPPQTTWNYYTHTIEVRCKDTLVAHASGRVDRAADWKLWAQDEESPLWADQIVKIYRSTVKGQPWASDMREIARIEASRCARAINIRCYVTLQRRT